MKTFTLLLLALLGFTVGAQAQSCAAPTNLAVSNVTATTAVVSFTPNAAAVGYLVRYYRTGGTASGISQKPAASSPLTLTNLQAAASYTVSVGSICSTRDTLYSRPQSFVTSGAGATCASVTNVLFSAISSTTATVSFTPVSGALGYLVTYYAMGDSANTHTITTTSSPVPLLHLQSGVRYVVRITTLCGSGTTSSPVVSSFLTSGGTSTCMPVTNVTVTATSNSTASVTFTPGAGNALFYISYHLAGDSTRWVSTSASPATLTGLAPGHTYYVQVLSSCGTSTTVVYTSSGSIAFGFRGTALGARAGLGAGTLEVFPNPAHQTVNLLLPAVAGAPSASVTLLNALGQPVRTSAVVLTNTTTSAQLDLTGLVPGLYTVRVAAAGQSASQRLAVE